jgi:hypothetical protein
VESFCSIDDHLPDGFYDAGRDMPFMSLEYERSLGLYAREVILLDRSVLVSISNMVPVEYVLCSKYSLSFLTQRKR